jgi:hypothetical protein
MERWKRRTYYLRLHGALLGSTRAVLQRDFGTDYSYREIDDAVAEVMVWRERKPALS